ncbi:MAG: helix-turn-helix transcriptional regulator [Parachlamydia sp.]|nr:helix-turn-helix transcriptional regulator [Parachlamydia sp.]
MMQLFKRYSLKHERKIKSICTPLVDCLNIPIFTYSFLEADGRFGYITNTLEFNDYYFSQKLYLQNPYFAHPALFRSGHVLCPCSLDEETQKTLRRRFKADHFFLSTYATASRMECFIFANENVNAAGGNSYLARLDLLTKFSRYFKREAKSLIDRMHGEQFNMRTERGTSLFETPPSVPLVHNDPTILPFLKKVSGLSPQELRCLELFKQGKSAQATGALLGLSRRTVEHYFENIKNKLGCSSKFDLLGH